MKILSSQEHTNTHFVYWFCYSNSTLAVVEYWQQNPWWQIPDQHTFGCVHEYLWETGSLPSVNHHAECQVQWNLEEKENIIGMMQWSTYTSAQRIFTCLNVPHMCIWKHYTQTDCIHTTHKAVTNFNLQVWVAVSKSAIGLMLIPKRFVTFCLPTRPILPITESTIPKTPI